MSGRYVDERELYERKDREDPATRFWGTPELQRIRFDAFVRNVPLGGRTVLDVGCGIGDFLAHLVERGVEPAGFHGMDIVPKFIDEANARDLPGVFERGDVMSGAGPRTVDWIVTNGLFGYAQEEGLWWPRYREITETLWARAAEGIALTLVSRHSGRRNPKAHYCDPLEILSDAQARFGCRVLLDHAYLDNDMLLVAFKPR